MSCQAISKSTGLRCRNHPVGTTNYCRAHTSGTPPVDDSVRCRCVLVTGNRCTRKAVNGTQYCKDHKGCHRILIFGNTARAMSVLPASVIDTVDHLFNPEYFRDLKVMHEIRSGWDDSKPTRIPEMIKKSGISNAFDKNIKYYKCMYFTLYLEPIFRKIPEIYDVFVRKYMSKNFLVIDNINQFFNDSRDEFIRKKVKKAYFPFIRVVPKWAYGRGTNMYVNDRANNINLSAYAVDRIKDEVYKNLLEWKKHSNVDIVDAIIVSHEVTLCNVRDYYIPLDKVDVQWHMPDDPIPLA
jgi:hypothetical protein